MNSRSFNSKKSRILFMLLFLLTLTLSTFGSLSAHAAYQDESQYFSETGYTVSGKFLQYWKANGGLPVYGYPITEAKSEVDPETGKVFLTQWFERNRFELHTEYAGTKYEVLLGLLGKDLRREALVADPFFQAQKPPQVPQSSIKYFPETGHYLSGRFLQYWEQNGGLERFGYPISELHDEIDPETGKAFPMQWFERARFESHAENAGTNYEVLLGLLGNQIKKPKQKVEIAWQTGGAAVGLEQPRRVAVSPDGKVYVTDNGAPHIGVFEPTGKLLGNYGTIGTEKGQLGNYGTPDQISFDGQGNIYLNKASYFGRSSAFLVQKLNKNFEFMTDWSAGEIIPNYVVADFSGNVYVADGETHIRKFDTNGKLLAKIEKTDWKIRGLALDSLNNLYVLNLNTNQIYKLDADYNVVMTWGKTGSADGELKNAFNFAVDNFGNVYVADMGNFRVQKFDAKGNFVWQWGSQGTAVGQFRDTFSVAVDRNGGVYIAESNGRLQKLRQL